MKKLPPEDTVKVTRVKRTRLQLATAKLIETLVRHWDLLSRKEQELARNYANAVGHEYAKRYPKKKNARFSAYFDTVVMDAWLKKIMNEVEFELWKSWRQDDPRVVSFQLGFRDERKTAKAAKDFLKQKAQKKNGRKRRPK